MRTGRWGGDQSKCEMQLPGTVARSGQNVTDGTQNAWIIRCGKGEVTQNSKSDYINDRKGVIVTLRKSIAIRESAYLSDGEGFNQKKRKICAKKRY